MVLIWKEQCEHHKRNAVLKINHLAKTFYKKKNTKQRMIGKPVIYSLIYVNDNEFYTCKKVFQIIIMLIKSIYWPNVELYF